MLRAEGVSVTYAGHMPGEASSHRSMRLWCQWSGSGGCAGVVALPLVNRSLTLAALIVVGRDPPYVLHPAAGERRDVAESPNVDRIGRAE